MGHSIQFDVFPMSMSKGEIFAEVDEVALCQGDSGSGLDKDIRWYDNDIQESEEEAEAFINEHDTGWYDQLAVPFRKVNQEHLTTKKTLDLKRRIADLEEVYYTKNSNIHYANVKSKTIACKTCESKLATAYLRSNHCPLCRSELRPDSVLKDLESKAEKLKALRQQLKDEEKKLAAKAIKHSTLMWLVKTEFHV